jgi:type IV secretory pathway component VirB8
MSDFDVDLVIGPRRAARTAWIVAACAVGVAVALAGVIVALLPLQRTEVFTVLVDGTTGAAERVYQVRPTGISDQEAVREALLVSYLSDREGYFRPGIQARLEGVRRRSSGQARRSLTSLWTPGSPDYPPDVLGTEAQVDVAVRSVTFLEPGVAQMRFTKTLHRRREAPRSQSFVATVAFEFAPRQERSLARVWENPLGFTVTAFRVDAEAIREGGGT